LTSKSFKEEENVILDYKLQQLRLFKQLSTAYALKATFFWFLGKLKEMTGELNNVEASKSPALTNFKMLKEIAAMSAGLKALSTILASNGLEECRKCCGGNGYLLHSGVAQMSCDFLWQVTAEGDYMILSLLTAKYLLK
jgi:acyl-CoA oxidase